MRIKWGLLLLLSGLVVWYFMNLPSKPGNEVVAPLPTESNSHGVRDIAGKDDIGIPIPQELIDVTNDSHASQGSTSLSDQQLLMQEINTPMFSDDPYVELFSLESIVGVCRDVFELESLLQIGQGVVYQEQQKALTAFQQQCENYQTQYPHFLAMDRKQLLTGLKPQSKLGLLLEQKKEFSRMTEAERNELDTQLLYEGLREQNSAVLVEVSFAHRFSKLLSGEISTVIGSKDLNYIGQISQMAIVNMSCQFQNGRNCEVNSALMMMICSQQPESCGQDFPTWYQQNTLPGMKNDVDTIMAFYQTVSH